MHMHVNAEAKCINRKVIFYNAGQYKQFIDDFIT